MESLFTSPPLPAPSLSSLLLTQLLPSHQLSVLQIPAQPPISPPVGRRHPLGSQSCLCIPHESNYVSAPWSRGRTSRPKTTSYTQHTTSHSACFLESGRGPAGVRQEEGQARGRLEWSGNRHPTSSISFLRCKVDSMA